VTKKIRESFSEVLRNNIDDPNPRRSDKTNFIYHDQPSFDQRMPRIGMKEITGDVSYLSSNTRQRLQRTRIQIIILTQKGQDYIIDGERVVASDVASNIAEQVVRIIQQNNQIIDDDIYDVKVVRNVPSPEGSDHYQYNVDVEFNRNVGGT